MNVPCRFLLLPLVLILLSSWSITGCSGSDDDDTTPASPTPTAPPNDDIDGDGYSLEEGDCDDANEEVNPGADEVCDLIDNDCDKNIDETDAVDAIDWFADADTDGYGDPSSTSKACYQPEGYANNPDDCNDADPDINPDATEVCDAEVVDEDCNGVADNADEGVDSSTLVVFYIDADGDGAGSSQDDGLSTCHPPTVDYVATRTDCDDSDPGINPSAAEVCDANDIDENCNGKADDEDKTTAASSKSLFYPDDDGDGFGDAGQPAVAACQPGNGLADNNGDCDDDNAAVNPGANEICDTNDVDENCNGKVDDDDPSTANTSKTAYYHDVDTDGFGATSGAKYACADPSTSNDWWTLDHTDCNDRNSDINPEANEVCNGVDDDCDGAADEADAADAITYYADADGDGFGDPNVRAEACKAPEHYVSTAGDCDDGNAAVSPSALEVCDASNTDENCNGLADDDDATTKQSTKKRYFIDLDNDGYGRETDQGLLFCDPPNGYVQTGGDCNDNNADFNPGAEETDCTDPTDYNCDGSTAYQDLDGDGFAACNTGTDGDCDDRNAAVHPGADEVCDGRDNDCDGLKDDNDPDTKASTQKDYYKDLDRDGFGDPATERGYCTDPSTSEVTWTLVSGDCDDVDAAVNPDATEVCNEQDDDCDGQTDEASATDATLWYADEDQDGFGNRYAATRGCSQPGGSVADHSDCDDSDPLTYPNAAEDCAGLASDRDCNKLFGCDDPSCAEKSACSNAEACTNGIDDDGDELADCNDPDCEDHPSCAQPECPEFDLGEMTGLSIAYGTTGDAGNDFTGSCGGGSADDLVVSWTAPLNGTFVFTTIGSGFDTVLYVRDGDCEGEELACNDDYEGAGNSSAVILTLEAGQTLAVFLDGYGTNSGDLTLSIYATEYYDCTDGVDNDKDGLEDCMDDDCSADQSCLVEDCSNDIDDDHDGRIDCADTDCAEVAQCNDYSCPDKDVGTGTGEAVAGGSTVGAGNDFAGTCGGEAAPDVTIRWTAPEEGFYQFDTFGSDFDTLLYVLWPDCSGQELGCNDHANSSDQSALLGQLAPGDTLVFVIDGWEGARGNYYFNVTFLGAEEPSPTPQPVLEYDTSCVDEDLGEAIGPAVAVGSTVGMGDDFLNLCFGSSDEEVAFAWTAPANGTYTFDTDGSNYRTGLTAYYLYPGAVCPGETMACDAQFFEDIPARLELMVSKGETRIITIGGAEGDSGSYILNISQSEKGSCGDHVDNDNDGLSDCEDPDCGSSYECAVEDCTNGVDDDYDLVIDCRDPDCAGIEGCGEMPCVDQDLGEALGAAVVSGSTAGLGNDFVPNCFGDAGGEDVLYAWTAPQDATYNIQLVETSPETSIEVFYDYGDGACPGYWSGYCDLVFDEGAGGLLNVTLRAGDKINLLIDSGGDSGDHSLDIRATEYYMCEDGIDNDDDGLIDCDDGDCTYNTVCMFEDCQNGMDDDQDYFVDCADPDCAKESMCESYSCPDQDLGTATGVAVATGSTSDSINHFTNYCGGANSPDVSFQWTAPETGYYTLSTDGSDFATSLALFWGTCSDMWYNYCESGWGEPETSILYWVSRGEVLTLVLDGVDRASGHYQLNIEFNGGEPPTPEPTPMPEYDTSCADIDLGSQTGTKIVQGSTVGEGDDIQNYYCSEGASEDIAYLWSPPGKGTYIFELMGSNFLASLTVTRLERGMECPGGWVASCDSQWDQETGIHLPVASYPDDLFLIVVDGVGGGAGDFTLSILPSELYFCADGIDNDGDGATDCEDSECTSNIVCLEEDCTNGTDDDLDLLIDCRDPDCAGQHGCGSPTCEDLDLGSALGTVAEGDSSTVGNDFVSACLEIGGGNDLLFLWTAPDYATYTFDTEGSEVPTSLELFYVEPEIEECPGMSYGCDYQWAPDHVPSLMTSPSKGQQVRILIDTYEMSGHFALNIKKSETYQCSDGKDNDGDGVTDCDDPDCVNAMVCRVEDCDNDLDDDYDYMVDCRDPDCQGVSGCTVEDCTDIDLGSALGDPVWTGVIDGEGNDFANICGEETGEDISFSWVAPNNGSYLVHTAGTEFLVDFSVLSPDGNEQSCLGFSITCDIRYTPGDPFQGVLWFSKGQQVNFVLDDYSHQGGAYSLTIVASP